MGKNSNVSQYRNRKTRMRQAMKIMKSVLLTLLLGAAYTAYPAPPNTNVSDVLGTIKEELKSFSVSQHNLAEMRDGLRREEFTDEERARVGDILSTTNAFKASLNPPFFVGGLVAEMQDPKDADTVRRTFYLTADNMVTGADFDIMNVNKHMTGIHNAAALAQAARVRDAMIAIRDTLKAVLANKIN
jgi:hypothetical protein